MLTISDFMIKNVKPCIGFVVCPSEHIGEPKYETKYDLDGFVPDSVYKTNIKYFSFRNTSNDNTVYYFYI